ncbi:MAG: hypothetical protein A3I44_05155 [Candidatus Sungbacteria bacterium RIFCSPLOWO2_02_FULL_51_17]|uniref:RecF/RecN/SMC N-terminal domain-containing protein n=1 Tax=Candidatus Sungbacteria bacterium RIFCSPHIGHO2_02_FULL_51_29 TaxID=1802273 RepID=A0A1G2KSW7_9BACT|nr:MAG: hypothetical protein A2676_05115 [Candidatus Sungbacteria bacterium RIFCSPHIGHO2_01_FULL_51_22]OHA01541.1 MAG: hypothetical protein A3C16_05210 [Candidatus Sungbacteria bacterium RIFCSPHIGHO2_02_FULL_51_29]OHA11805.1 MAG: hypothetical protein A3I44_05155 [Candidatus Sungbacteria bacterium RIFCSPLOWO2_02_FULL_51_17]
MQKLKRLELSGFKSFARQTTLEFSSPVSVVVGPNGSGKSNVAESIRWVLGEQSMKSLRGKRGEDLIFNGTEQVSRMGKAAVSVTFDNKDGSIPLDFEEVTITRKIFRDGQNEYYLNESQVRLKDVIELVARMGLGETKHNIIGQGDVDRILLSSPRERRELIEEAIGLRVYHLKKNESERKLAQSKENLEKVASLIRELVPHVHFLRIQAKKAESRASLVQELKLFERFYFRHGFSALADAAVKIELKIAPLRGVIAGLDAEIEDTFRKVKALEGKSGDSGEVRKLRQDIAGFETEESRIQRELGRIEGRIDAEKAKPKVRLRVIDLSYVKERIRRLMHLFSDHDNEHDIGELRRRIDTLKSGVEQFLSDLERGSIEEKDDSNDAMVAELEKKERSLKEEMDAIEKNIRAAKDALYGKEQDYRTIQQEIRTFDRRIRELEEEKSGRREALNRFHFEEEKIRLQEEELQKEFSFAGLSKEDLREPVGDEGAFGDLADVRRKIERMRARLEEVGGIDDSVIKEFQDAEARHTFLVQESEDIKKAIAGLEELIAELSDTLTKNFHEGFLQINEQFNNYFRVIFGGGRAGLKLVAYGRRRVGADEEGMALEEEEEEQEEGAEMEVDIPKKRIKGMHMLSGGERALVSIAFLFAVTAVNPPPFLILDETDAALDEANSKKFGAILKELSKKTQLIIITHNRETMRQAGILYGVTMGGDGVSKLLSLRFEEAEAYTNR